MKLGLLPIDVLSEIAKRIDAEDVMRLWFCGSGGLNTKLSRAVQALNINLELHRPIVWPVLVSSLRNLTSLELSVVSPAVTNTKHRLDRPTIPLQIETLPDSLTALYIKSPLCTDHIFHHAMDNPGILRRLRSLSLNDEHTKSDFFDTVTLPFVDWFPQLETLRLTSKFPQIVLRPKLLPRTLTDLHIEIKTIKVDRATKADSTLAPLWPAGLTRFTAPESRIPAELLLGLPPSLTHLDIARATLTEELWDCFPPQLTTLVLKIRGNPTAQEFAKLPRTLTSLDWGVVLATPTAELLKALPPSLTRLPNFPFGRHIAGPVASALPRGLRFVGEQFVDSLSVLPHLPRTLEMLCIINISPCIKEFTYLKSLHVSEPYRAEDLLEILPPSLTKLRCPVLPANHVLLLPAGMKELHCSGIKLKPMPEDDGRFGALFSGFHLTSLVLGQIESPPFATLMIDATHLPLTLTELTLPKFKPMPNAGEFFASLPSNLITMSVSPSDFYLSALGMPRKLKTLWITCTTISRSLLPSLPFLPAGLSVFGIRSNTISDLSADDLALLPRGLLYLMLPYSPKISPSQESHNMAPPPQAPKYLDHIFFTSESYLKPGRTLSQ